MTYATTHTPGAAPRHGISPARTAVPDCAGRVDSLCDSFGLMAFSGFSGKIELCRYVVAAAAVSPIGRGCGRVEPDGDVEYWPGWGEDESTVRAR